MSLFQTVEEQEAKGKVKAVYEDIKATKGIDFVPNRQCLSGGTGYQP